MTTPSDLDSPSISAALTRRKSELEREIQSKLSEMRADHIGFDSVNAVDGGDAASIDESDEIRIAEARRDGAELSEIELALKRLETGHFGICIDCGTSIGNERLRITPTATRCISCQKSTESH